VSDFLRALFCTMNVCEVRYFVLHTWKELPEALSSDLDIAVHPRDRVKLLAVFETLRGLGFFPIECRHYAVEGYAFVFAWFCGADFRSLQLDVIFVYGPRALVEMSGEQLVAGRVRHKDLWIAHPSIAFSYLLIKKTVKGEIRSVQSDQLAELLEEIGRPAAEAVVADIFGERWKIPVVDSCSNGTLRALLPHLDRSLCRTPIANTRFPNEPIRTMRHFVRNSARLIGRWF
jgi:hypothetical protein